MPIQTAISPPIVFKAILPIACKTNPVFNKSIVSLLKEENVVSPPKKPTVNNNDKYCDAPVNRSVNYVEIMPIKKQPTKFTVKVP